MRRQSTLLAGAFVGTATFEPVFGLVSVGGAVVVDGVAGFAVSAESQASDMTASETKANCIKDFSFNTTRLLVPSNGRQVASREPVGNIPRAPERRSINRNPS
jgi:hypothetical protein